MILKVVGACLSASILVFAAEGANFDVNKAKSRAIETLDKDIKILNDAKSCVSAAKSKADFQACRDKAKTELKAAKADSRAK